MANDLVNEEICDSCLGKGWDFFEENDGLIRLERCDSCEMFDSDDDAATAVYKALEKMAGQIKKDTDWSKARYDEKGNNQSLTNDDDRAYQAECQKKVVRHVKHMIEYWSRGQGTKARRALNGLGFSILNMLDGLGGLDPLVVTNAVRGPFSMHEEFKSEKWGAPPTPPS